MIKWPAATGEAVGQSLSLNPVLDVDGAGGSSKDIAEVVTLPSGGALWAVMGLALLRFNFNQYLSEIVTHLLILVFGLLAP